MLEENCKIDCLDRGRTMMMMSCTDGHWIPLQLPDMTDNIDGGHVSPEGR